MLWGQPWGSGSAWGGSTDVVEVVQRGTHDVAVIFTAAPAPWLGTPTVWEVLGPTEVVVASADVDPDDTAVLLLGMDRTMGTGLTYQLRTTDLALGPFPLVGIRVDQPQAGPHAVLRSWDVRLQEGGAFHADSQGGFRQVTGLDSLVQMVWTTILTPRGTLPHAPTFGMPLDLKGPQLLDLPQMRTQIQDTVKTLPFITAAQVDLAADGADHVQVTLNLTTSLGRTRSVRTVKVT